MLGINFCKRPARMLMLPGLSSEGIVSILCRHPKEILMSWPSSPDDHHTRGSRKVRYPSWQSEARGKRWRSRVSSSRRRSSQSPLLGKLAHHRLSNNPGSLQKYRISFVKHCTSIPTCIMNWKKMHGGTKSQPSKIISVSLDRLLPFCSLGRETPRPWDVSNTDYVLRALPQPPSSGVDV